MAIKLIPDVGAPAVVFAADWATSAYDEKATGFKLNRPVGIVLAIGGYTGAMLNFGGDFVKNIGIASFDWAANSIVSWIRERGKVSTRLETSTPVRRLASPAFAPQRAPEQAARALGSWAHTPEDARGVVGQGHTVRDLS